MNNVDRYIENIDGNMSLMTTNVYNINKELLPLSLKLDEINFLKCEYEVYKFDRTIENSL